MANVIQGLFGFNPTAIAQQRADALSERANAYAARSPIQNATAAMYRGGSQLGDAAAGLMGIKDPELEAQSLIQKTSQSLDLNDPVAVRGVAKQWLQSGNPTLQNKALLLNDVADKAEASVNERSKEKAANEKAALMARNQEAFTAEYNKAPDAAGRLAVTRKYADMPTLIKMDEAATAREDKSLEASLARQEKAEAKKEEQARLFEQQRFLAGENAKTRSQASRDAAIGRSSASNDIRQQAADIKATALQDKINQAAEKAADADSKADRAAMTSISHATKMMSQADEAKSLVKTETTGHTGRAIAAVNPGGEAGTLARRILTIKSNIGFDALAKMRAESPTGGALGQVAVQELEALQASVASLDTAQSPKELARNLDAIKTHYSNWKDTVIEDAKARAVRRASNPPGVINIPGAVPRNATTKPVPAASGWGKAVETK